MKTVKGKNKKALSKKDWKITVINVEREEDPAIAAEQVRRLLASLVVRYLMKNEGCNFEKENGGRTKK